MKVLYIASSSFSGSTLLSFLLNTHPDITTVGEMEGWKTADENVFPCSCGAVLKTCPFFRKIAEIYRQEGLEFSPRDFGTGYRLAGNERINQYLTEALPWLRTTAVERFRDWLLASLPATARVIARNDRSNIVFMRAALALAGAKVFVDAGKSPYRTRYLRRLADVELHILHLIRDPRGVVTTFMENRGWDASPAMQVWMQEQLDILRILREIPDSMRVHYEDLCDDVNGALGGIHRFVNVPVTAFGGDFQAADHHILGNSMRLDRVGQIVKSERWKTRLSRNDRDAIARKSRTFIARHSGHPLSDILARYLD